MIDYAKIKQTFATLLIFFFLGSVALNIYLFLQINSTVQIAQKIELNSKILSFRNMFVENVLLETKEIDFDTRLEMENVVRGLQDNEVLSQWQKFVKSDTEENATREAKELLRLLIEKTSEN